jgi:hypothetical protein
MKLASCMIVLAMSASLMLHPDPEHITPNSAFAVSTSTINPIWTYTGNLVASRIPRFSAVVLQSGKVLIIANGSVSSPGTNQLYDPATEVFTPTGNLNIGRYDFTTTLLEDGRVLVSGGYTGALLAFPDEVYDPVTGAFTPISGYENNQGRSSFLENHTATLLPNGNVLLTGGDHGPVGPCQCSFAPLDIALIFDPVSDAITMTASMHYKRSHHASVLLPNGTVLVAGGVGESIRQITPTLIVTGTVAITSEIYSSATGIWVDAGVMNTKMRFPTGVLLNTGKVLMIDSSEGLTELYDPATDGWFVGASMLQKRRDAAIVELTDGRVMVAGGSNEGNEPVKTVELYDPVKNRWTYTSPLIEHRTKPSGALLQDARVLILGGERVTHYPWPGSAELYGPSEYETYLPLAGR